MTTRPKMFAVHVEPNASIVTTTELVVATIAGVYTTRGAATLDFLGWMNLVAGTGTTDLHARIRRGTTIGGTLVGEISTRDAAAGDNTHSVQETLAGVELAGESFVLTVQQVGATGNGTLNAAHLTVLTRP